MASNPTKSWRLPAPPGGLANEFHKKLPGYSPTPLVSLPQIAQDIGVGAVFVKNEEQRFGLPSFKVLGASWATFRALVCRFNLPSDCDIPALRAALSAIPEPPTLLAATDGNHGRAVARMGAILGLPVRIFVPSKIYKSTVQNIKDEGAVVEFVNGSYDLAVKVAFQEAGKMTRGVLVQDTAFPGYEEIPRWVIEGYATMLSEVDEQLTTQVANLVIAPVGVGSFAQAVTSHYKVPGRETMVLTVEPDTAACLYNSLVKGEPATLLTSVPTIMEGLNCETVSSNAWPVLMHGVDASLTVSDFEVHEACRILESMG
ncbi:Diaminopropionate ammonia-lyase, partial [Madurella mycetomatis]